MVRNILAVIAGIVIGGILNLSLIMANMAIMPAGTDFTTTEGVNAAMADLQPLNFALVFLAHALGTLVGAAVATLIAVSHKIPIAIGIGCFFLIGGIYNAATVDAPLWFEAVDLIFAYIPMAWIGGKLGGMRSGS